MSKQEFINHFFEFVKAINNKPGMYLVNNIEDMGLVVFGYKMGCSHNQEHYTLIEEIMNDFRKNINDHFNTTEDLDWVRLIRFYCVNDATTLDFFKQKFNEFASRYAS